MATGKPKPVSTSHLHAALAEELAALRQAREEAQKQKQPAPHFTAAEANAIAEANAELLRLPRVFEKFRLESQEISKTRQTQLQGIEKTLADDHVKIAKQFESVNDHLTQLMLADGKLRSDLEQFILKHDAPKVLVRIEEMEKKVGEIEKRNSQQDGAALALKVVIGVLGFVAGLAVKYL
jgi:DNA repair exonuclease SbcCD ATPase subunit